jgi:hypothetical protein
MDFGRTVWPRFDTDAARPSERLAAENPKKRLGLKLLRIQIVNIKFPDPVEYSPIKWLR